jgi:16S rRNA (adenine1518-N6/adenine1519-N6)-dimethyltransferase
LEKIIKAAELCKDDIVLEIGPGLGTLTQALARKVKKVIAVESDWRMVKASREILAPFSNIEIVYNDALKICLSSLNLQPLKFKLVANLPYHITSAVLRKFLSEKIKPSLLILMVQKEVALRLLAKPGEMSVLPIAVSYYGKPEIIAKVPQACFFPKPKVDSAIIKIKPYSEEFILSHSTNENWFFKIVKAGFSSRRKQLQNNLAKKMGISKKTLSNIFNALGFSSGIRAQELCFTDWERLSKALCLDSK